MDTGLTSLVNEEDVRSEEIYAAEEKGYKFIEVHLNSEVRLQDTSHIAGILVARAYRAGEDENNIPIYHFIVGGGYLKFLFDRRKRRMVAHVLDDDEKGAFSPKGFNRDFLATHINMLDVVDKNIAADIRQRAEAVKKKAMETRVKNKSTDELDKEIEALQKRKIAVQAENETSKAPVPATRRKRMSEAARKKFGADMKAARQAKKDKEAALAEHETISQVDTA